jgi:hypothetical protein
VCTTGSRQPELPVPRSLAKLAKGLLGEKRRSMTSTVIDTDQFKQTELHIYDAYRADLQTQTDFTLEIKRWKAK